MDVFLSLYFFKSSLCIRTNDNIQIILKMRVHTCFVSMMKSIPYHRAISRIKVLTTQNGCVLKQPWKGAAKQYSSLFPRLSQNFHIFFPFNYFPFHQKWTCNSPPLSITTMKFIKMCISSIFPLFPQSTKDIGIIGLSTSFVLKFNFVQVYP